MATYYPSTANQRDIMPALYMKDSGHVQLNESALQGNMLYLNYPPFGSYSDNMGGSPQQQNGNVGFVIPSNILLQGSSMEVPDLLNSRMGDPQYNAWREGRNELSFMQMQTVSGSISGAEELVRGSGNDTSHQMNIGPEMGILNAHSMQMQQSIGVTQGQGLSLTLSTQIPGSSFHYRPANSNVTLVGTQEPISGNMGSTVEESSGDKQMHVFPPSHGISSLVSSLPNSRYLKAAQQLLDEVVNVRKALKSKLDKNQSQGPRSGGNGKDSDEGSKSEGVPTKPQDSNTNSTCELSPSARQDLQNKLTKLLAMLDEVDRRYKQYYHQMQIVVSSFDVIAGSGAAKPYTALALQTISRHFRCLRDAISGQIRATRESLGEQDGSSKGAGLSRLRYIDQQLRQQRAFQQFGMMQHHAWRPQRGLPENSVSILRAWLFEHFLHPYPKDSDKIMLARQAGLTRSQVSNWFINARVRLWKPMIEEMYKEEIGDAEIDSISSSENATRVKDIVQSSEDRDESQSVKEATEKPLQNHLNVSESTDFHNAVHNEHMNYINSERRAPQLSSDENGLLQHTLMQHASSGDRFMAYQMADLRRYMGSGPAGVSLTLGLQHCDGGLQDAQRSIISLRGNDMLNAVPSLAADSADYNCLNLPDSRQGFSSSHLLHDFVA